MSELKTINIKIVSLLVIFLLLLGCGEGNLAFRTDHHQESILTSPVSDVGNRRSISVIIGVENFVNRDQDDYVELEGIRSPILHAYSQSSLFSHVKPGFSDADLSAEVKIVAQEIHSPFISILYSLTLGIIPSYGTQTLAMKTVIKDREGNVLGTFEDSGRLININHLIFDIFPTGIPPLINSYDSLVGEIMAQLCLQTIAQAHTKGIF
jgi:hypothetical protein